MTPSDIIDGVLIFFAKGFFWPLSDQSFFDTPVTALTATALLYVLLVWAAYYPVSAILKIFMNVFNFFVRDENKKITNYDVEAFAGFPAMIIVIVLWLITGSPQ